MVKFEDKIVVVTKKTALEELVERFNTREQARFYLEHMGLSFDDYQAAHDAYHDALVRLKMALPNHRTQFVERNFLPTFLFGPTDIVMTLGPDGLVVNTAKYLDEHPLIAVNPDPARVDGVLVPFAVSQVEKIVRRVLRNEYDVRLVTMARATLNDGQSLHAVNDLFIGQKTHVSARYRLRFQGQEEDQSSSGIIVSTGAGSTGWLRSVLVGAVGVVGAFTGSRDVRDVREQYRFAECADCLKFTVREPFVSRTSSANVIFGEVAAGESLEVVSHMPQNGVIFSDGVESDFLQFNSGAVARIEVADRKVRLVAG